MVLLLNSMSGTGWLRLDWQTSYQSLVSAATSIAAYQIAQRHISPVIVTALTLQGIHSN